MLTAYKWHYQYSGITAIFHLLTKLKTTTTIHFTKRNLKEHTKWFQCNSEDNAVSKCLEDMLNWKPILPNNSKYCINLYFSSNRSAQKSNLTGISYYYLSNKTMHKIVWCSYKPSLQQKKLTALQTYIISTQYIPARYKYLLVWHCSV